MRKLVQFRYLYQLLSDLASDGDVNYSGTGLNKLYADSNSEW